MYLAIRTFILCGAAVHAAAIYSTSVSSTFGIATGFVTMGPSMSSSTTTGAGTAFFSGVVSTTGVLPATKVIGVSGLSPFAVSTGSSTYQSGHLFTIDNSLGLTPIFAPFTFEYSWSVSLGAGSPFSDFATGGAFFHITGIDNEILSIGGVPVPEFLVESFYTTELGGTGGMGGAIVAGGIFVPAGVFSVFSVITDTAGSATTVPEPATFLPVAVAGIVCLVLRRSAAR